MQGDKCQQVPTSSANFVCSAADVLTPPSICRCMLGRLMRDSG